MFEIACECDGLPPHDHFMGLEEKDGIIQPRYDYNDIGRIWVNWKEVAKSLIKET